MMVWQQQMLNGSWQQYMHQGLP